MWVLLIILAVILLIAFMRITVTISYREEVGLTLKLFGFIKIKILPRKQKKIKIRDYSEKKYQKRRKKADKKALKKRMKAKAKKDRKDAGESKPKASLFDNIKLVASLLKIFFKRFSKHLKIKVTRIIINISTGDAASTAILYGAVSQSVAYILELLSRAVNVKGNDNRHIEVNADFVSGKTSADVCISFSLFTWHAFDIVNHLLIGLIKNKFNAKKNSVPNIENPASHTQTEKK